jgi:hypothetical protein
MLYELRVYDILPGKVADMHARFANVTSDLFKKHGIREVGYWESVIGTSNQLIYMLAWEDMAERERKWVAFGTDPAWMEARAASEANGQIVAKVTNSIMRPTAYSPMK